MKPEHQEKCHELINEISSRLKLECYRLYNSGGIDPEAYSVDDYQLARILVTASMLKAVDWYYPIHGENREAMKNLTFF